MGVQGECGGNDWPQAQRSQKFGSTIFSFLMIPEFFDHAAWTCHHDIDIVMVTLTYVIIPTYP